MTLKNAYLYANCSNQIMFSIFFTSDIPDAESDRNE